ncbi:MAG: DNA-binding transcriptional MerR regulator [Saprospiraceae bacterium]|jgi:DNA-binding transcriptional MerR regulator|tara:strand:+ start:568 stop:1035 length:468 start_codon:yes stop_codon:yes gene_type:complete
MGQLLKDVGGIVKSYSSKGSYKSIQLQLIERFIRFHDHNQNLFFLKIEQELTKLYYSIGEVSEMFSVSNSLIRYWEAEFSILKPSKNSKGDRRFMVKDIRNLENIYTLVKERGFTLDGAKKELKKKKSLVNSSDITIKLKKIKNKMEKLLKDLEN